MGLILDSSVLIAAERRGKNAKQSLITIADTIANNEIAISVVTLAELAHGAARADTLERKAKRHQFIQELMLGLPVYPVTAAIALRVGELDGENRARGMTVPLADLMIGMTAIEHGHSVATHNVRHFQSIPNLKIIQF